MPTIMAEDDFHAFVVKMTTIGPFLPDQVRALGANEAAWNELEKGYDIARSTTIWIQAHD